VRRSGSFGTRGTWRAKSCLWGHARAQRGVPRQRTSGSRSWSSGPPPSSSPRRWSSSDLACWRRARRPTTGSVPSGLHSSKAPLRMCPLRGTFARETGSLARLSRCGNKAGKQRHQGGGTVSHAASRRTAPLSGATTSPTAPAGAGAHRAHSAPPPTRLSSDSVRQVGGEGGQSGTRLRRGLTHCRGLAGTMGVNFFTATAWPCSSGRGPID